MNKQGGNLLLVSPKDSAEAYIGLREENGVVELWVPHGYPEGSDVKDKQKILGELMRAVMRFSETFFDADRSCYDGRSTRDGILKKEGGQSLNFDSNGATLGYTNFARYLKLIRMLRDPRLLAITKAPGLTAQFDHRYIAHNLERAMFLQDGTPVFDFSWASRPQMRHTSNVMVGLACWMALDAVMRLFPDSSSNGVSHALQSEWEELGHRFADEHELDADASLFTDKRKDTLLLLQTALETCIRRFPPVSSDARELHHLLDELLYYSLSGQDGDIWGLRGFYHVWESACLEHAIKQYGEANIFTCDDMYLLPDIAPQSRDKWKANRHRVFSKNGIARRPDLVVGPIAKGEDEKGIYLIIDFKYYDKSEAEIFLGKKRPSVSVPPSLPNDDDWRKFMRNYKVAQDIASIECYRWLLMQHEIKSADESKVELEFWIGDTAEEKCKWAAYEKDSFTQIPNSDFNQLSVVYKPAREIIRAYAEKFDLMG